MREQMNNGTSTSEYGEQLKELGGGYDWTCGGLPALANYYGQKDVQTVRYLVESVKMWNDE